MYHNLTSPEAKAASTARFEKLMEMGKNSFVNLINEVQTNTPTDKVLNRRAMKVKLVESEIIEGSSDLELAFDDQQFGLHPNALQQLYSQTAIMPKTVGNKMIQQGRWGQELLAHNLNTMLKYLPNKRLLTREVGGQVRGILSDKYKRLDSGLLLETFLTSLQKYGAVPIQSHISDVKWALKVVLPTMFEPVTNEVLLYGIAMQHSDFGKGAYSLRGFTIRLICLNGMISEEVMRRIHLGSRLSDNIQYSNETYELDSKTIASATKDIVSGLLEPANVDKTMEQIRLASEDKVDPDQILVGLNRKGRITKDEKENIAETFNSAEVEMLPPGNSTWRLANAMSLFAQSDSIDVERRLELEQMAADVLPQVQTQ